MLLPLAQLEAVNLLNDNSHLTIEGLNKLINIKASINLGLSEILGPKSEFNSFIPVKRPKINTEKILDYNWVAGFVTGEGCFEFVKFLGLAFATTNNKIGYRVQLRFRITQHERDKNLME